MKHVKGIEKWAREQALKVPKSTRSDTNAKKVRYGRAKELLRLHMWRISEDCVFWWENFPIEQFINFQNDRIYLTKSTIDNLSVRMATWSNFPSQVMVWAAMIADERSSIIFIESGVKGNATYYGENVLKALLEPWASMQNQGSHHIAICIQK